MKTTLFKLISQAMNRCLALDQASSVRLARLNGKVFTIELLPFHWVFHLCFEGPVVSVKEGEEVNSHAKITGTPLQLLGVMIAKNQRHGFFSDDVTIEGNAELAQDVTRLFDELEIDYEACLSSVMGDVSAYHLHKAASRALQWWSTTNQQWTRTVNEYVHEEANWFPAREALQDFFADIDDLRMDVDRLAARVAIIDRQLNANGEPG